MYDFDYYGLHSHYSRSVEGTLRQAMDSHLSRTTSRIPFSPYSRHLSGQVSMRGALLSYLSVICC